MLYTQNYQFRKPVKGLDDADIDDLNYNADRYDAILHASQVSLADAYDATQTYNTDDVVMYEFYMYKCLEDNVTGTWDSTKWERTVASSSGASGSDVEANPSGTATDTLNKIGIDGTIYGIEGGGGAGGGGCFIDTTNVIQATASIAPNTDVTYTATQDCAVVWALICAQNGTYGVEVDGVAVSSSWTQTGARSNQDFTFLKKGQTIKFRQSYTDANGEYTVYGLTYTTQNIQPLIYSTEEREVGVWTDGKPLYQKSYTIASLPNATATEYSLGITDIETVVDLCCVAENSSVALPLFYNAGNDDNSKIQIHMSDKATGKVIINTFRDNRSSMSGTVTIWYTKTTDTAGSGIWTPSGVPAVHYSEDEQVVGTWVDGKTLYQKTLHYTESSEIPNKSYSLTALDVEYIKLVNAEVKLGANGSNDWYSSPVWYDGSYNMNVTVTPAQMNVYSRGWKFTEVYATVQYTKITD